MRRMAKRLRHRGWEVHIVGPEHDVDQAISELHPHVVVFPESQGDESGYLACAKMLQSWPFLRVIVVGAERTPQQERFARFVGGVYATVSDDLHSLLTHLNE
ncbi:MAG: hypothetical protein RMJ56_02505 [Gemmataceae bacterium]|nr:hypothetical protein [Gemmata sp.]MDW8196458.1 hypothetical protein [Gemmataceae bacterium]